MKISEIAKLANVSVTTVSRVLNNSPNVSLEKKLKVQKIIDEYSYVPSNTARKLRLSINKSIAIIVPDLTNEFTSKIVNEIAKKADFLDYSIILCNSQNKYEKQLKYIDFLISERVQGIIILPTDDSHLCIDKLKEYEKMIPLIFIYKEIDKDFSGVYIELKEASKNICLKYKDSKNLGIILANNYENSEKEKQRGFILSNTKYILKDNNFDKNIFEYFENNGISSLIFSNANICLSYISKLIEKYSKVLQRYEIFCFEPIPTLEKLGIEVSTYELSYDEFATSAMLAMKNKIKNKKNKWKRYVLPIFKEHRKGFKMKKMLNDVSEVVSEMLEGICYSNDKVYRVEGTNVIAKKVKEDKVGLVSGGGSGHEPAHAGYVAYGLLDAAVSGEVFTSPTPDQVLAGIMAADNGKGVLLVIKNYTGDVMNFEMAAEMAEDQGIKVEKVIVADDIAVENSLYTIGRRGVAGTVFVHKIAGSAAQDGKDLAFVKEIADEVVANTKTLGMSIGGCTVPASGKPSFVLADDEIEMGLGIHGEPGTHKEKIKTAKEHVQYMCEKILEHSEIKDEEVVVLVNGLGSTTLMELYIINKNVNDLLKEKNIKVHKSLVGNYMTSLEMPGFSISILKLSEKTKKYFDFDVHNNLFK